MTYKTHTFTMCEISQIE